MVFKNLADYHLWAGRRVRSMLDKLSDEEFTRKIGGKSARDLCEHIVAALETCFYLASKDSNNSVFDRIETYSKSDLMDRWSKLDNRLSKDIRSIPQDKISVPHITDEPFEIDVMDFYLQYLLHTTHHRGQLVTKLRELGLEVVGTDYLMFFAEMALK
jgi:uncharacterized damage-inducible protein DinB